MYTRASLSKSRFFDQNAALQQKETTLTTLSELLVTGSKTLGKNLGGADRNSDLVKATALRDAHKLLKNKPTYTNFGVVQKNFQAGYEEATGCDDNASRAKWNRFLGDYKEAYSKFVKPRSASVTKREKAQDKRAKNDAVYAAARKVAAQKDAAAKALAAKVRDVARAIGECASEYKEVALTFNGKRPARAKSALATLEAVHKTLVTAREAREKLTK